MSWYGFNSPLSAPAKLLKLMDMQIQTPPPELVEQPKHFVKWTDQVRIGAHKDHQEA